MAACKQGERQKNHGIRCLVYHSLTGWLTSALACHRFPPVSFWDHKIVLENLSSHNLQTSERLPLPAKPTHFQHVYIFFQLWEFPGKSTGVGCQGLFHWMYLTDLQFSVLLL